MNIYLKSFLLPPGGDPPDLGVAVRLLSNQKRPTCAASQFLYHLVDHCNDPVAISQQILRVASGKLL
ncbi:hypothetical protein M422DRAFT_24189 [Sphaerobolus stellatus SS14]|nr:hypothetical protein M422DRAFT_24189 [Sphaerobolus stellatus SS14]